MTAQRIVLPYDYEPLFIFPDLNIYIDNSNNLTINDFVAENINKQLKKLIKESRHFHLLHPLYGVSLR